MTKIDIHIHCAREKQPMPDGSGNPNDPDSRYICTVQEMLKSMATHDISTAVIMSCGETINGAAYPFGADNTACLEMHQAYPKQLQWMCNFDPARPETLPQRMADCKARGAVGVGEVMANQWMDSPFLKALFRAAADLGLPVLCHMSPEPGFSYGICDQPGLPLLKKTLAQNPNLIFLGHSQLFWLEISGDCPKENAVARSGYGHGPVTPGGAVPRLLESCPNLYGDLSGYSAYCAITRDEAFGLSFLERWQDRLLFATDATNCRNTPPLADFLDRSVASGKLSRTAYQKICRDNAMRLFAIKEEGACEKS